MSQNATTLAAAEVAVAAYLHGTAAPISLVRYTVSVGLLGLPVERSGEQRVNITALGLSAPAPSSSPSACTLSAPAGGGSVDTGSAPEFGLAGVAGVVVCEEAAALASVPCLRAIAVPPIASALTASHGNRTAAWLSLTLWNPYFLAAELRSGTLRIQPPNATAHAPLASLESGDVALCVLMDPVVVRPLNYTDVDVSCVFAAPLADGGTLAASYAFEAAVFGIRSQYAATTQPFEWRPPDANYTASARASSLILTSYRAAVGHVVAHYMAS
jgi:hypothetical protein